MLPECRGAHFYAFALLAFTSVPGVDPQVSGLCQLRQLLAEELARSGLEEQELILWGVPMHLDGRQRDGVLSRFLRASNFQAQGASSKLVATLQWRRKFAAAHLSNARFPAEYMRYARLHGEDKKGCAVIYDFSRSPSGSLVSMVEREGPQAIVRWWMHLVERAASSLDWTRPDCGIIHIVDYASAKWRMPRLIRDISAQISELTLMHYAFCFSTRLEINLPSWKHVRPSSAEGGSAMRTLRLSSGATRASLLALIRAEQLLPKYGGFISPVGAVLWCTNEAIVVPAGHVVSVRHAPVNDGSSICYHILTESGSVRVTVSQNAAASGQPLPLASACTDRAELRIAPVSKEPIILTLDNRRVHKLLLNPSCAEFALGTVDVRVLLGVAVCSSNLDPLQGCCDSDFEVDADWSKSGTTAQICRLDSDRLCTLPNVPVNLD